MKKAVLFIHGWVMDDRVFHRKWIRELGAPLYELFSRELDHSVFPLTLPGNYLQMDKDYDFYADRVCKWISGHPEFDEIVLIGHSMGAITARWFAQRKDDAEGEDAKRRVRRVILLGSPNRGTGQPIANTLSRFLTTIGHKLLPRHIMELTRARSSFLEETPCYRDLDAEGKFIEELNKRCTWPEWIEVDNLWTLTDTVVEPTHSAILPGKRNHLLDVLSINHFNMPYRKETADKIRSIMKGTARPSGPQGDPPGESCEKGEEHDWWPQYVIPIMETRTHWKCRSCGKVTMTQLLPEPFGCSMSRIREGPHNWRRLSRSHSFKYRCRMCGKSTWYPIPNND